MGNVLSVDAFANATAAAAGGIFSCSMLYPIEIVKNNMQAAGNNSDGKPMTFREVAKRIYKEQGISGFVDGVAISASGSATEKFIYFYAYKVLVDLYETITGTDVGVISDLIIGYVSEFIHLPISMPLDTIGVKIQTNKDPTKTIPALISKTIKETGMAGFYKGVGAYVFLSMKPSIQFATFEFLKRYTLGDSSNTELTALQAFVLGAIGRAVATLMLFPYTRAKVIKQSRRRSLRADSNSSEPTVDPPIESLQGKRISRRASLTPTEVIQDVIRKDGFASLYQGVGPELFRGVLSAAMMLMVKEKLFSIVKAFVYSILGGNTSQVVKAATA